MTPLTSSASLEPCLCNPTSTAVDAPGRQQTRAKAILRKKVAKARKPRFELRGEPLETAIQRDCLKYLQRLPGCHAWRANSGAAKVGGRFLKINEPGTADILACYRGKFLGVEVKRVGEAQRPEQVEWQRAIEAAGGTYIIATSWTELRTAIEGLEGRNT